MILPVTGKNLRKPEGMPVESIFCELEYKIKKELVGIAYENGGILATGTIAEKFADTVNHMEQEDETLIACASRNFRAWKSILLPNTGSRRFTEVMHR